MEIGSASPVAVMAVLGTVTVITRAALPPWETHGDPFASGMVSPQASSTPRQRTRSQAATVPPLDSPGNPARFEKLIAEELGLGAGKSGMHPQLMGLRGEHDRTYRRSIAIEVLEMEMGR